MAELWQLDHGYKVKVLDGKNKGKEGYVVYCSRFGDICIDTKKRPDGDYKIREFPKNLEIVSMDNPFSIKNKSRDFSNFDCAKFSLLLNNPKKILDNQKYFTQDFINSAKSSLNAQKSHI